MDTVLVLFASHVLVLLVGVWMGRHPERMRALEQRALARLHTATAPAASTVITTTTTVPHPGGPLSQPVAPGAPGSAP